MRVKQGRDINQKFSFIYEQIQSKLNGLFDADSNKDILGDKLPGLRQIIEKKQGTVLLLLLCVKLFIFYGCAVRIVD